MTRWIGAWLVLTSSVIARSAALPMPGPERLPADTWVLVNWHGVANATQVRNTNPVMKLWNDPQFAAARDQIIGRITASMGKDTAALAGRAVLDDVFSVLENPVVFGVAGDPMLAGSDSVHFFGVLNRKGQDAAWTRLNSRKPPANAEVSTYSFRGVQIEKTVTTTMPPRPAVEADKPVAPSKPRISYSFQASLGDHELYSDSQAVMESLITRLKDGNAADDSLLKNTAYQRAQRFRAEGPLLEAFVKVPDLTKIPVPANQQINLQSSVRELHPERIQGLWFSAGMGRDRMLMRGALLADMTPGSLLDLIGNNVTTFQTLAAAPATESYAALRIELPALYATLLRAVKAGMPPDRGAAAGMMVDSLAIGQTGMRAVDLLSLFTGEVGLVRTGEEQVSALALPALLVIPVTSGEQALGVLRKVAAPLFAKEEKVGTATVVKIDTFPPRATGGTDAREARPLFLAVTPNMLLIGSDRAQLDAALLRNATGTPNPAGSLAADAKFRSVRSGFPAAINGLSYTDISRVRWELYINSLHQQMAKARQQVLDQAARAEQGDARNPPNPARAAQLRSQAENAASFEQILVDLFPLARKYLKTSAGASWKAADGMFFDSFVN